jgi:hypothetical protein
MIDKLEHELMVSNHRLFELEKILREEIAYITDESQNDFSKVPIVAHISILRKEIEDEYREQRSLRYRMLAARECMN